MLEGGCALLDHIRGHAERRGARAMRRGRLWSPARQTDWPREDTGVGGWAGHTRLPAPEPRLDHAGGAPWRRQQRTHHLTPDQLTPQAPERHPPGAGAPRLRDDDAGHSAKTFARVSIERVEQRAGAAHALAAMTTFTLTVRSG
jgi:hypothetical protein